MTQRIDPHAALMERERGLPGLRILFEPARLAHVLQTRSGVRLSSIEPVHIRYKRRTNCLVGYRVNGPMGSSYVYGKALRLTAGDKVEKSLIREAVSTWLGPGPLVLRDEALVVWAHPNDARLRGLCRLADDEGRESLLCRAPTEMRDAASTAFRTLSYKPERRFVAELRPRDPAARGVLKMYTRFGYEQASARSTGARSRDVLRVPTRLARDRRRHLLFFGWLEGRLAADLVSSPDPLRGRMALVGEALAELHDQPVDASTLRSPSYDVATATKVISDVEFLFPTLADPLARLRACLAGTASELRHSIAPVHGDFHLRQVLVSPSSVGFLDFDRAGPGPAAGDIGYCRAHLERDVLAGTLSRERADDVMEELLTGYARIRHRPLSQALDIYTAAALALLLSEPFRLFQRDAFDLTARILDRALALLMHAESRTVAS